MAMIKVFVKEVGQLPVEVTARPSDTIAQLKEQLHLTSMKMRLRQQNLLNNKTLEECGVKPGDALTVFSNNTVPKGFASRAHYLAKNRLDTQKTQRARSHPELAMQTQEVMMRESAMLSRQVAQQGENLGENIVNLGTNVVEEMKKVVETNTVKLIDDDAE